ncbi:MAG: amidohydrolase family protein, partial [Gemmatimonadota bacterium]|nr:amidohydrolase family protein [Gemmatimonadota bacterium]
MRIAGGGRVEAGGARRNPPRGARVLKLQRLSLIWWLIPLAASAGQQPSPPASRLPPPAQFDLLIRGGQVVDGTGAPARVADVGIRGDRIVFVGRANASDVRPTRTIDATGLVVAPGFVDPHAHVLEDLSSAEGRANVPYLMQGVTTVVTGNDGSGPVDVAGTLALWERHQIGTNAALLVGHGSVRRRVLGMSDAAPTAEQLDSMRALVARAMEAGALGLSSGLYYAPGSYGSTEEVIELAKVAARAGGVYDSHLRDESSYTIGLLAAVDEAIRIGREAAIPVNISHIKALGADVWGLSDSVIARIRAARAAGVRVTADQYPYLASGSNVGASLLPRWAEAGGGDSLRARLTDPASRVRIVAEMERNLVRRGGPASLLITASRESSLVGKTLERIAAERGVAPVQAAVDIVLAGGAAVASFNMAERDVEMFMRQDFVMTGSDGSTGHPRKYGTFPRKLREYVFSRGVLTLPDAIRRSSGLAAETFGIRNRGRLADGYYADVIVFDPATVADRATYEDPTRLAVGMRY